jgi:thiamine pyrophosphate-dependent acetolactate synthase large subunit-like protein
MESLMRAWTVAQTEPKGPVYICFDVELQEAELPHGFPLPDVERYPAPSTLYPDPSVLEKTANWLAEAAFPVIIADRMGRDGDAVKTLTELAELLSIPVLDGGDHFNFASTHPLDLTGAEADILSRADLVVGLEVDDLFGALHKVEIHTKKFVPIVSPQARIVDISLRDQLIRSWATDFQRLQPVDLSIAAQSGAALSQLLAQCQTAHQGMSAQKKRGLEERKAALEREHDELRARWRAEAEGASKQSPVSLAWLASVAWETIKGEDWMLANGTLQGWARRLWDWQKPHQFLGASGGGGLGYGLGASLGAALAHRGSGVLCIDLQADGDLLFTPQALWTAAHHEIPLLMIVDNNRAFLNTENHAAAVARHRGRPEERKVIGTTLEDPTVDFSGLARSFGIHAEGPIDNPADIKAALQRAVQEVKKGNAALVDVVTAKGG